MKLGVALALIVAFPAVAAAQYGFQLRPSPYRIMSGWDQDAHTRAQPGERGTRVVTPVSDRMQGARSIRRDGEVTGSTPAPR